MNPVVRIILDRLKRIKVVSECQRLCFVESLALRTQRNRGPEAISTGYPWYGVGHPRLQSMPWRKLNGTGAVRNPHKVQSEKLWSGLVKPPIRKSDGSID